MLAVGLSCMTFIEVYSLHTHFLENLYHRWIFNFWIFVKTVSASIEMIIGFLFFNLLMWCITLIDLWILKNPCISEESHFIMVYDSFNVLLYLVCQYSVEDFCIYVHQWYWPVVFFFVCCFCLVLVSGWRWPDRMSLEVYLPLQFFRIVWER